MLLDEVKQCLEEAYVYSGVDKIDGRVRVKVHIEGVFDSERGEEGRGSTISAGNDSPRMDEIDLICFLVDYTDERSNQRIQYLYELRITDKLHHSWFNGGEKKDHQSWKEAISEMVTKLKSFLISQGVDESGGGFFGHIGLYTLGAHNSPPVASM